MADDTVDGLFDPCRFVVISVASWMNEQQQRAIEDPREENKALRGQSGGRSDRHA